MNIDAIKEGVEKRYAAHEGKGSTHSDVIVVDAAAFQDIFKEIKKIRTSSDTPLLVICEQVEMSEVLNAGADDCVEVGCTHIEFKARLAALERRSKNMKFKGTEVIAGDSTINLVRSAVTVAGDIIHLAPSEYRALIYLAMHQGALVSKAALSMRTIKDGAWSSAHLVNMHIYNLRKKVGKGVKIVTVPRRGFMLEA